MLSVPPLPLQCRIQLNQKRGRHGWTDGHTDGQTAGPLGSDKKGGPYGPQIAFGPVKKNKTYLRAIWPSPGTFSHSGSSVPLGLKAV